MQGTETVDKNLNILMFNLKVSGKYIVGYFAQEIISRFFQGKEGVLH